MSIYAIFNNLPALLVVVPLLLSPIAALIPIGRLAWVVALFGSGVSVIVAILLCSVTASGIRITYFMGNWPPPWGIEFVVDSATSLTVMVMTTLAFLATLFADRALSAEIAAKDVGQGLFGVVARMRRPLRAGDDGGCVQSVCLSGNLGAGVSDPDRAWCGTRQAGIDCRL